MLAGRPLVGVVRKSQELSRIGKQPIKVPGGVKVSQTKDGEGTRIDVEGPKGRLSRPFRSEVSFAVDGDAVVVTRRGDSKFEKSYHGTARALVANMVAGVHQGFRKTLEIQGVGYTAKLAGKSINLQIGFSHPLDLRIPDGLTAETPNATTITISGADKQAVGEFAAQIRRIRPPEPYNGKGIRYQGEQIVRKAGKTFGSGD